jgi:death-on-curing protein
MIRRSGYRLVLGDNERIDDIVVSVADGQMPFDALVLWLASRLVRD